MKITLFEKRTFNTIAGAILAVAIVGLLFANTQAPSRYTPTTPQLFCTGQAAIFCI